MDARYINPFLSSTTNALEIMAGISLERGTPFVKDKFQSLADVSGVIGFAGGAKGALILSFPLELAQIVYKKLTYEETDGDMESVSDAIGELANMVVGGAKSPLSEMGLDIQISIPSVVAGKDHTISIKSTGQCIVVPFKVEEHTFWMQISMKVE